MKSTSKDENMNAVSEKLASGTVYQRGKFRAMAKCCWQYLDFKLLWDDIKKA